MRLISLALVWSLAACKGGGGGEGDDPFPDCDTDGEAELVDGIGLGFVSVDAHRSHVMGQTRYDVIVHGDDDAVTQFIIAFTGMPVEGMEYEITDALVNDQPMITLYPQMNAPELVAGTLTFTNVATETGELLELELRLELATGELEGCIRTMLTATTDGSDTDTAGTSGTGDSTGG